MKFSKRNAKGFSLIELLIVVAIILIIAAIAIPNLMRSKIAANQASAVGSLRTINTAEVTYSSTYNIGYSATLVDLGPMPTGTTQPLTTSADLIDSVLAGTGNTSNKSGYTFSYSAATAVNSQVPSYACSATPQQQGTTGQNGYYTDQTNVIRFNTSGTAGSADSPIGG